MRHARSVVIDPMPPKVDGGVPWVDAGWRLLRDPTRLIPLFDRIDSSDAFVRPGQAFLTWATRRARERRAMHATERVVADIWRERAESGVVRDALAWTLGNVLDHPEYVERIRSGDDALLEACANESIRFAQRSITPREVVTAIDVADEERTYRVSPQAFVTTMLSVTNTGAAPGLERFDPAHYAAGRRLVPEVAVPAKELVSTFGHGGHSCPAARFSISAIRIAVRRLLEAYDLHLGSDPPAPRRRQIGGIARAERPVWVRYEPRTAHGA